MLIDIKELIFCVVVIATVFCVGKVFFTVNHSDSILLEHEARIRVIEHLIRN